MAKLPALIDLFAEITGRERTSLDNISRELRRAGLISGGKRGVGAPEMTGMDFTNLLLSCAARRATDAVEVVTRLRGFELWEGDEGQHFRSRLVAEAMVDADVTLRVGKVLDTLFDKFSGNVDAAFFTRENDPLGLPDDYVEYRLERIEIHEPIAGYGRIKFFTSEESGEYNDVFVFQDGPPSAEQHLIQNAAIVPSSALKAIMKLFAGND